VRVLPVPPERIRRFVACEWGWHGPAYEDGHIVFGYHQAHARYLSAWSAWIDENDVDLMDWFDRYRVSS
jgi:hypothetical protein